MANTAPHTTITASTGGTGQPTQTIVISSPPRSVPASVARAVPGPKDATIIITR